MKTVFFGGSSYVIPIIEVLRKDFGLSLVVVKNKDDPLINYCKLNTIPFEINGHLKYALEEAWENDTKILNKDFDLGIVADYGVYIPNDILTFYPKGILNIHPSILPKFRGPTPVQTAILSGETKTGVTIIKIDNKIDHGPILAQKEFQILKSETSQDLLKKLFQEGSILLKEVLPKYINGTVVPKIQDDSKATFTRIFVKDDGLINIDDILSFEKLEAMISAYFPWPGVWTKTSVGRENERIIKFLPNKKIQVEGKKEMSYKDFLNGYPDADVNLKEFLRKHA
ncbi:MAG: hypothetical protein HY344_03655 [Candidatus Levybacteria bacterium]|nr:hypothetical protein [Candidatus Levybacteria bacterium]